MVNQVPGLDLWKAEEEAVLDMYNECLGMRLPS